MLNIHLHVIHATEVSLGLPDSQNNGGFCTLCIDYRHSAIDHPHHTQCGHTAIGNISAMIYYHHDRTHVAFLTADGLFVLEFTFRRGIVEFPALLDQIWKCGDGMGPASWSASIPPTPSRAAGSLLLSKLASFLERSHNISSTNYF